MAKPVKVNLTIENLEQMVASEVYSVVSSLNLVSAQDVYNIVASLNVASIDVTAAIDTAITNLNIPQMVDDAVAQAVASLEVPTTGPAQLNLRMINGYTVLSDDDDVMVTSLPSDTDVATVHLPPISSAKKKHFLIRNGGMNLIPDSSNTIQGMYSVEFGVETVASQVMIGSTASLVYKKVPVKYDTANLVSDGIDTWYVM